MKATHWKTVLAGLAGGFAMNVAMLMTFRFIGFGWNGGGIINQGLQFGALVFLMTFLFWEFFTPFNLFGEPLHLIVLELLFWACIAIADGLAISAIIGERASNKAN